MTPAEFRKFRVKKLGCEFRGDLAALMAVSVRAIESWELGARPIPGYAIKLVRCLYAVKLAAKELGVDWD